MVLTVLLAAPSAQAIVITRTSATNFFTDIGGNPSRRCNYVSYTINNNDGVAYPAVWVAITNFTGGVVGRAATEDGVVNLGSLAVGETKAAFFYLCANVTTAAAQSHAIAVFNGPPALGVQLASQTFSFTLGVEDTIQANANKVTTVVAGPTPPELGGLITITVDGDSGTIGAGKVMTYTAAVLDTWPANAYELYASSITLSGGNSGVFSNQLLIPPASLPDSSDTHWTAVFFLRAVGTTATPTTVSPTAYISSGTQTKHTDTDPASLPPIAPTDNFLLVRKAATPTNFLGTGLVTFTLTLTNGGNRSTFIDTVVDRLPSFPSNVTYVTGSSILDTTPIADPIISGQTLTWLGTFALPAGIGRTLTFQASFPAAFGSYTNRAIATVGPSQIDTTASTADDAPALAVVSTVEPNADVAVFKSGATNVTAASNLTYTITVTNLGPSTVTNVTVTDTLPPGTVFAGASNGGSLSNGLVRWSIAALALNTGTNFTLTLSAPSNSVTLTNIAAASSPMPDLVATNNNGSADTARVITLINAAADLVSAKSGPTNVTASSNLTYTISVTNLGPSLATNLSVADTLPSGVTFVDASPAGTLSNNVVSWPVIPSLAAGAATNFTVTITAPVEGGSITNTATVSSPVADPDPANNNGTGGGSRVITLIDARADLAIAKTGATNVTASSNILYTISLTNLGPSTASNVVVSDALPPGVTFVSASAGGSVSNNVVSWPALPALAGGAVTNFSVTIAAPANSGIITNIVSATSLTTDPDTANNDGSAALARVITTVGASADLALAKTGLTNVLVATNLTYTLLVTNLGPSVATNVTVSDTLPPGVTFVSASAGGALSNNVVTWSIPALAVGSTNFTVTVLSPSNGMTLTNIASAVSPIPDITPGNNDGSDPSARVVTLVDALADLAAAKSGPTNALASSNLTYTISITNFGPSIATNVSVADVLPAGVTVVSASPAGSVSNNVLNWPVIPSLAAGAVSNFTVTITAPLESARLTNVAVVSSPTSDGTPNNNDGSDPGSRVITVIDARADLAIAKSGAANVTASSNILYTITLTNLGPSTASNVVVSDTLPPGVTFVSASGGGAVSNNVVSWPAFNALPGGAVTNFTVTVSAPASAGTITNIASATTSTPDPDPANNDGSAAGSRVITTVSASADLVLAKSGPASVLVATNFSYTLSLTNLGPSPATNVTVTDALPTGVTFVSATGGGTLSNNVVTWSIPSLAVGSTNFTVTVLSPSNGMTLTNIASATSPIPDLTPGNNDGSDPSARVVTLVDALADLAAAKSGPTNALASSNLTYTISVTNFGPSFATNVSVADVLPAGVTVVNANPAGSVSNNVLNWPLIPSLAAGAVSNFTVTITAPVESARLTNVAVVSSPTPDATPGNNDGSDPGSRVITVIDARADLAIAKTGAATVVASSNLVYTLTLTNLGPSTASNVVVSDTLPPGVAFVSASGGGALSNNVVAWPTLPALAGGAVTNFTVTVSAPASAGTITNIASATTSTPDPDPANNDGTSAAARAVTVVTAAADLFVLKSGPVAVAVTSNFTYTISVTNLGPSTATNVATLDLLPAGATMVSASGGGALSNNVVAWPVIALLPAGAGTNFTITLTAPAAPTTLTNVASAGSATFDPDPVNNDGSSANSRVVTAVGATGATISGFVYLDANHNGFKDGSEAGTGLAGLFAKIFPATTPNGPALTAVPVDPATGAYALSNILGGVYYIVIDTGSTLSDVTPSLPAGWSGTEMPAQLRTNVAVTPVNLPNQNFGLVNALTITGRVFADTGHSGGTANDGILNGGEPGLAGVVVRLTDATGATTYDTANTDGNGAYSLLVPNTLSNGVVLRIVEVNPPGHLSSGASVGTTGGTYSRTNDTITFTFAASTAYTGIHFGDVPANTFTPDGQLAGLPGTFVVYPHTFVAGSAGSVTFSVVSAPDPVLTGWSQVLYLDANCNGTLDAGENPITAPIPLAAGDKVCLLVKEFIPLTAPFNAQDRLTVNANFTYTGASPPLAATTARTDLTTVGNPSTAGLTLLKSVDKPAALPGETLTYTVTYANNSAEPLNNIILFDTTPAFTTFLSATNSVLASNLTSVAISAPSTGGSGAIKWTFTGTLRPGGTGTVEFKVNVEQ